MKPQTDERIKWVKRRYWQLRGEKLSMNDAIEKIRKELLPVHLSFETVQQYIWNPSYAKDSRQPPA